jgi:general secretion pathway protein A
LFSEAAISAVYRYSRGLPRLINTICENALIAAYARRLLSVTPEIIEYVAKEFRLDVDLSPDSERAEGFNQMDAQRAIKTLLDLIAALEEASQATQSQARL